MKYTHVRNIFIVLSLVILVAFIVLIDPVKIAGVIVTANLYILLLALVLATVSHTFLKVFKWKVLLDNVPYKDLLPIQMVGMTISNFTPGRIAEPVKNILLKIKKNIPVSESLQSVIFERIIDIVVLVLISFIGILVFSVGSIQILAYLSIGVFLTIVLLLVFMIYKRSFGIIIFNFFRKFPIANRLSKDFIETFYKKRFSKKPLIKCFLISLIVWLLEGVVFYLCILSFGITVSPLIAIGIVSLAILIGNISFLPGGIGSSEIVMILLLTLVGVPSVTAAASTILFRILTFWYMAFLGLGFFVKDFSGEKIDLFK
ncbi:MAG: flippase-like domain-containing protein [Candidatus Aenigmarchaeota archaeon]|nr:flippase-like domain-containing protein [Candidatus Aenigmarchaeota archaeon]